MAREPISTEPHYLDPNGVQKVYRFPNGFGASVIRFRASYGGHKGLWELAIIQFESPDDNENWVICYDLEEFTNDVFGWLSDEEVEALLDKIEAYQPGE
jgi:hypothetical protein